MTDVLNTFPTVGAQTLRALARYPDRIAFSWPGGSITYRGATDLIARLQNVFMNLGAQPGTKVALLTANRAETWCAGVAATGLGLVTTWLHASVAQVVTVSACCIGGVAVAGALVEVRSRRE